MFSKKIKTLSVLVALSLLLDVNFVIAETAEVASVNANDLPINVAQQKADTESAKQSDEADVLMSPSQPAQASVPTVNVANEQDASNGSNPEALAVESVPVLNNASDDDFDLKMKAIKDASNPVNKKTAENSEALPSDVNLPKNIQYKTNPIENLGNSVLSQLDSDLFTQMSDIEKSMTLLTLELRREKIRNEIEAQKAIRQKNADEIERKKREDEMRDLEKKKQLEAQVIREQQLLVEKEKLFEVLRQRKLLNAYMNQMLVYQQEWLKEKEALYAQLAEAEQEKKDLIELFKQKIDNVLEASAQNIRAAEAAKANFERIVTGLKARNEQLRKRIEADAQIIRNAKNTLYLKSQSIEESQSKNKDGGNAQEATASVEKANSVSEEEEEDTKPKSLSAEYAILGIIGRSGVMSVDVIDIKGQPMSLKVGSPLPTGHVVSEIGSDYVKFSRDGVDDYLYVGRTIDGITPTLGLSKDKNGK